MAPTIVALFTNNYHFNKTNFQFKMRLADAFIRSNRFIRMCVPLGINAMTLPLLASLRSMSNLHLQMSLQPILLDTA